MSCGSVQLCPSLALSQSLANCLSNEGCECPACRNYSRGYIRHLLKAKEMLGMRLCVLHNLFFYNKMVNNAREAILQDRFAEFKKEKLEGFQEEH